MSFECFEQGRRFADPDFFEVPLSMLVEKCPNMDDSDLPKRDPDVYDVLNGEGLLP
jgi:hypothetical protein